VWSEEKNEQAPDRQDEFFPWRFIRVGTGLARVKMDKATVRSMLQEAGSNRLAKHHVYIEQRELHIALLEDRA